MACHICTFRGRASTASSLRSTLAPLHRMVHLVSPWSPATLGQAGSACLLAPLIPHRLWPFWGFLGHFFSLLVSCHWGCGACCRSWTRRLSVGSDLGCWQQPCQWRHTWSRMDSLDHLLLSGVSIEPMVQASWWLSTCLHLLHHAPSTLVVRVQHFHLSLLSLCLWRTWFLYQGPFVAVHPGFWLPYEGHHHLESQSPCRLTGLVVHSLRRPCPCLGDQGAGSQDVLLALLLGIQRYLDAGWSPGSCLFFPSPVSSQLPASCILPLPHSPGAPSLVPLLSWSWISLLLDLSLGTSLVCLSAAPWCLCKLYTASTHSACICQDPYLCLLCGTGGRLDNSSCACIWVLLGRSTEALQPVAASFLGPVCLMLWCSGTSPLDHHHHHPSHHLNLALHHQPFPSSHLFYCLMWTFLRTGPDTLAQLPHLFSSTCSTCRVARSTVHLDLLFLSGAFHFRCRPSKPFSCAWSLHLVNRWTATVW